MRFTFVRNLGCNSVLELQGLFLAQAVDGGVQQSLGREKDEKVETLIEIKQPLVWQVSINSDPLFVNKPTKVSMSWCFALWNVESTQKQISTADWNVSKIGKRSQGKKAHI